MSPQELRWREFRESLGDLRLPELMRSASRDDENSYAAHRRQKRLERQRLAMERLRKKRLTEE